MYGYDGKEQILTVINKGHCLRDRLNVLLYHELDDRSV